MPETSKNLPAWQTLTAIDDPSRAIPAVEFRNVNFAYDDHVILNAVSFEVMPGETLLVLSGSGGGKSTILKLGIGLLKPDDGEILIEAEDITHYDEEALNIVRQKIGMDFQEGALFDSLSVYDNVAFRCHENQVPEEQVEAEVRRLLSFVNLEHVIDMMPAQLSGGLENVRFMTSTYACLDDQGTAVFMKEADHLCLINTKIMMLHEGRVIFLGSDEELLKSEDPYIKDFLLL